MGVDDRHADLDLWALVPAAPLADLDRRSPTRFFGFELDGKQGHLNVEDGDGFRAQVAACRMPLLAELRTARVLDDAGGFAAPLLAAARLPMPDDVRLAWFRLHHVELRSWHRIADNAVPRGDAFASLLSVAEATASALRAAMVLDRVPYPYDKWLAARAFGCPTGAHLRRAVERVVATADAADVGPSGPLAEMRAVLLERAALAGIDGPWLQRWWLHLHTARSGVARARWPLA